MAFVLTPGRRHEAGVFEELMRQGAVKRRGAGRPRSRPERVCGDKGYGSGKILASLRRRGIRLTIPRKRNEKRRGPFDREMYRRHNVVERSINRLKQFRRIATRYEKKAKNYLAMLQIAAILLGYSLQIRPNLVPAATATQGLEIVSYSVKGIIQDLGKALGLPRRSFPCVQATPFP